MFDIERSPHTPLEIIPLTPNEQRELDPTGYGRAHIAMYKAEASKPTPMPSNVRRWSPSEWLQYYLDKRNSYNTTFKTEAYCRYDDESIAKWSRQGGTVAYNTLKDNLLKNYSQSSRSLSSPYMFKALHYFMRLLEERIAKIGLPVIDRMHTVFGTAGALPTGCKKGTFPAETVGMSNWRHLYPDLPGCRRAFSKDRIIHMDSNNNVRYVDYLFSSVRKWLIKAFPEWFSAWRNPRDTLLPGITASLDRHDSNVEWDFESMDLGFGRYIVENFILPIYERLLPEGEFFHFAHYCDEIWTQPIFMGKELWTGEHNLLSGQVPTNDWETIYSVLLHIAGFIATRFPNNSYFFAAIGDDSILLLHKRDHHYDYFPAICEISAGAGETISKLKSREITPDYRFCRRQFYPGFARDSHGVMYGAYPMIRTLQSCVMPEFSADTLGSTIAAQLQRWDNAFGSPLWHNMLQWFGKNCWRDLSTMQLDQLTLSSADWWERLYGEKWQPETSFAYRFYVCK